MDYRYLGNSGLQVSALSYGAWVTFGSQAECHASAAGMPCDEDPFSVDLVADTQLIKKRIEERKVIDCTTGARQIGLPGVPDRGIGQIIRGRRRRHRLGGRGYNDEA